MEEIALVIAVVSSIASLAAGIWKKIKEEQQSINTGRNYAIKVVDPQGQEISFTSVSERKAKTIVHQLEHTPPSSETGASSATN
jgi:predicted metallopeptidase